MKKLIIILFFVFLGCEEAPSKNFIEPTEKQYSTIMSGFKGDTGFNQTCAIKSKDFDDVYFVALDIPNRGVGVWALGGSGGSCFAVNDVAQEVSVYPQGQISMFDDGALDVKKCVQNKKNKL